MGKALLLACGISAAATGVGGYWLYDNNSREFPKPDTVCGRYSTLSFDEDIPRVPRAAVMYELDPEYTSLLGLQEKANQLRQEHSGPNNPHAIGGVDFSVEGEVTKERVAVAILTGVLEAHLERKANRLEQHYLSGRYTTAINREPDNTYSTQGYYYDALLAAKAYREIATPCKSTEVYLYGVPGGIEIGALAGICERAYNEEKTFINQGNLDQVIDFLSEEALISLGECIIGKKNCAQRFLRDLVKEDLPFSALEEILDRVSYGFSRREVQEEVDLKIRLYRKFVDYIPAIPYDCLCTGSPLPGVGFSYDPDLIIPRLQERLEKLILAEQRGSGFPTSFDQLFPVVPLFDLTAASCSPRSMIICESEVNKRISECVLRAPGNMVGIDTEILLKNMICMWREEAELNPVRYSRIRRLALLRPDTSEGMTLVMADVSLTDNPISRRTYQLLKRRLPQRDREYANWFKLSDSVINNCRGNRDR